MRANRRHADWHYLYNKSLRADKYRRRRAVYQLAKGAEMDYIKNNKAAWEEAFEHKHDGWGDDNYKRLLEERLPFFCADAAKELMLMDFKNKCAAQFCCNNGRELLSLMQLGPENGVGFDIAENIIKQASDTAQMAGILNCRFVARNILDIEEKYCNYFDFIMFTIGAITWFKDLTPLFKKVSDCLKPGGTLFIHDFHPVMNMLPMPGEPEFDETRLNRFTYSYFRDEPWIENEGMGYMSKNYSSKTFTSFSHTISSIINAISNSKMRITKLREFDYDIGLTSAYDGKGVPLSYILIAQRM